MKLLAIFLLVTSASCATKGSDGADGTEGATLDARAGSVETLDAAKDARRPSDTSATSDVAIGATGADDQIDAATSPRSPDVAPPRVPDAAAASDSADASSTTSPVGPFTCTMLISLNVTEEWYREGFETKYVAGDRWELRAIHAAFVDQWADPKHPNWSVPLQSACKTNPNNPDRVIFVSELDPAIYLTAPQSRWESEIRKVIVNIQAKYSNVKRIELMTFVRSPGNKPCPGNSTENVVAENLDKAIAALSAERPALIGISPKLFLESCSQYTSPPHFNSAGGQYVAKQAGEHYAKEER